ncbi:MAG: tetratricopeptide repeat protein [Muribaculaceae bacterium]|nr:tetratricopeptide repeat protein [Muribaculaceae bacterium]
MKCHKILVGWLLAAAALTGGSSTARELNSPGAPGYIARGRAMLADLNCLGVNQQTEQALRLDTDGKSIEEVRYLQALAALHSGSSEAPRLLAEWISDYPESPRRVNALLALGDCYFADGHYGQALQVYYKIGTGRLDGSANADLIYRMAYCELLMGNYSAANRCFERLAADGRPPYADAARFYMGYIAYRDGDYSKAQPLLEKASRSGDPDIAPAASAYLAQIFYAKGDNDKALAEGRKVLASKATALYPEANRVCGEALYALGRTNEAIPLLWLYADAVENPAPSALYILGADEYDKGEYQNAVSLLRRVVTTETPQNSEYAHDLGAMKQSAWLFLGQAYAAQNKPDQALMAFDTARQGDYDPTVAETAFYNYAVATIDGGRAPFGSSVRTLEQFLSTYPDSKYAPKVEEYIIAGYMADNNYTGALESISRIKNPSSRILAARQRVLFELGTREYGEGKYQSAYSHLKEAAALESKPYDASIARQSRLWEGMALYELGRYKEASATLGNYLRNAPAGDARTLAWYNLGYSEFQQEQFQKAYDAFAKAAAETQRGTATTRLADTYNRMADCMYYRKSFGDAEKDYMKAYELNPSAGDYALFQAAVMKGLQRDNAGKIAALDDFMNRFPTSALVADALLEKAETQVAMGNNEAALQTYHLLTDAYSTTATGRKGYLQMAITLLSEGRNGDAERAYKAVISKYPTSEEARMATDDLKRYYADNGRLDEFARWIATVGNAPKLDASEMDDLSFAAAEKEYISNDATAKLSSYLQRYPQGSHRARALYYMAEASSLSGNQQEAYKYAAELLSNHPDAEMVEDALLIKADAETAAGRTEEALATFNELESRAVSPTHLYEARLGQLRNAAALGHDNEVIAAADKLLASTAAGAGSTAEVRELRAEALSNTGDSAAADEEWNKVMEAGFNDIYGARAAVLKSQSLLDRKQTKEAHELIDKLINSNPPHQYGLARGFIVLSDVLRAEGDDFEANQYLQSLRTNYPGSEADITRMIEERLK